MLIAAVRRCCCESEIERPSACSRSSRKLPYATRRSRLTKEGAILPSWRPVRLPRSLVTAGLFHIYTRPSLSELFASSHFLFLRFCCFDLYALCFDP